MVARAALEGLRVLDLSNVPTGAQTSQFLADFGAEVILVERPGNPLRSEAAWPFWGRGKQSIELDLRDSDDLAVVRRLAEDVDIVIETFRPGVADRLGLGYETLAAANPRLIYTSITGFGRHGPLANLQGYEPIVMSKFGGPSVVADLARREGPTFTSVTYATFPTVQLALQGILTALYERESSGLGQWVETSMAQGLTVHDSISWFLRVVAQRYPEGFRFTPRTTRGIPMGGLTFRLLVALTADGHWLQFSQTTEQLFRAMMKMLELDWMFDDPEWSSAPEFEDVERRVAFWEKLLVAVRSRTAAEWADAFDRDPDVWGERFRNNNELLHHPQMEWNGMVVDIEDPEKGPVRQLGALVSMSGTPAVLDRPAPRLDEHGAAIRARLASAPKRASTAPAPSPARASDGALPLDGITIVEFAHYFAAPFGATLLTDLGARVIKLEPLQGDPFRSMAPFPDVAAMKALQGKESVAVDLATPEGREIAYKVIKGADLVLQSFRAGVAKRLGFDADTLQAINPDLIYLSAPGYGEDGPCGHRPAFAPTIGAAAGMAWRNVGTAVSERADLDLDEIKESSLRLGGAIMGMGNADGMAAAAAGTALLLGLVARKRGAGAQQLLTTMLSSTGHCMGDIMVDYAGRPELPVVDEGMHGFGALYRLYPAAEGWVFLAVVTEREWSRFAAALPGGQQIADDPRFDDAARRKQNDAALIETLGAIFATRGAAEWERLLRAADVACVEVASAPAEAHYMDEGSIGDLSGFLTKGHHPFLEEVPRLQPLIRFSRSGTTTGDAGLVGQHTRSILSELGYGDAEIDALSARSVIHLG